MLFVWPGGHFWRLGLSLRHSPKGGYTKLFGIPKNHLSEPLSPNFGVWLICAAREIMKQSATERSLVGKLRKEESSMLNCRKNALERATTPILHSGKYCARRAK